MRIGLIKGVFASFLLAASWGCGANHNQGQGEGEEPDNVDSTGAKADEDSGTESSPAEDTETEADENEKEKSGDSSNKSDSESDEDSESSDESDSSGPSPDDCEPPEPDPAWIADYQREIVAVLSGAKDTPDGKKLGVRSSTSERAAARDFLVAHWSESYEVQEHDYSASGSNLYVVLPATNPPRDGEAAVLVFGAHFDTVPRSPGANDNATGVAAVMAASKIAKEIPCRTRSWHFVLFDQEEIGLVGSDAYAKKLKAEGTKIQEVHTIDQMGWDDDQDRAIELERPSEGLMTCYEDSRDHAMLDFELKRTKTGATDHVSFRKHGFPAIGITEEYVSGDTTPHYHKAGDIFETVDLDYLKSTTILINQMVIDRSQAK